MKSVYKEKNLEAIRQEVYVGIKYCYDIYLKGTLLLTIYPQTSKFEFESAGELEMGYFYEIMSLFLQIHNDYERFVKEKQVKAEKP